MTLDQRIDRTITKIQDLNWALQNPYAGNSDAVNASIAKSTRKALTQKRSYLKRLQRQAGYVA